MSAPPPARRPPGAAAKFLLKLAIALAVGGVCVALVVKDMDTAQTWAELQRVSLSTVALYLVALAATHVFRVWRWRYLLRPIGVTLPWSQLFAVSSAGFMMVLALPVRLGEFVRPYFVVRLGQSRMSAVLGTIAVERIVDGLIISLIFFGSYLATGAGWSPELRVAAWLSLAAFAGALLFLVCALRFPERTIRAALAVSLLPRLAPRLAERIADKLRALIHGFRVLHEPRDLVPFVLQSLVYWGINGLGMWLLAEGMGLTISPVAAFASMSFTGVLITLPNAPGLVGQFHLGVKEGLRPYVAANLLASKGMAYAVLLHGIQSAWYVAIGFLSLLFLRRLLMGARSLREVVIESERAAAEAGVSAAAGTEAG